MSLQTQLNLNTTQFLSRVDILLQQLGHTWTQLGPHPTTSSSEVDYLTKLLPTLNTLDSLLQQERHQHELMLAHIQDQVEELEQLCLVLGRPLDQYVTVPFTQPTGYTYHLKLTLDQTIADLTESITTRRQKIHHAQTQILTLSGALQIPPRELNYDAVTSDVSAMTLEPILHYHDQLAVQYQLHVAIFNTAVSRIHFKWLSLSMEPEEKDQLDLQLYELFEGTPTTIDVPPSLPGVPDFTHAVPIHAWFTPDLQLCMAPLAHDTLQILLDKARLDQISAMPLLSRNDLLTRLRYFYELADMDPDSLPEKLGDLVFASLRKIKSHCDEMDAHIDENVVSLTELHMGRLKELWEVCHVAQETMTNFHAQLADLATPRERLETIYDDYALLKFQFENAPDIFSKIRRRKFIIDKLREFESKHNSKDRFKGSSLALLQEEKFRKKEYPALYQLENSLLKLVIEYEARVGRTFKYEGGKFRLILEKSIERRFGNLEIIGLKDAMATESFSRPRLSLGKDTTKSKEKSAKDPESSRSPSLTSSRPDSRSTSRAPSRATSRSTSRTGTLTSPRPPSQPLRSPTSRSRSGTASPANSNGTPPLLSPTSRHTRLHLTPSKSMSNVASNPTTPTRSTRHSSAKSSPRPTPTTTLPSPRRVPVPAPKAT